MQKPSSWSIFWLKTLSVIAIALFWTGEAPLEERIVTLRYFLFALVGISAFITPYLLYPDRLAPILQLGNPGHKEITFYLLKKLGRIFWPVYLLIVLMMSADLNTPFAQTGVKLIFAISACVLFTGVQLFAAIRYTKSGLQSQFWKESERGREVRKKVADYLKYPLDPGAVPSLINTILIFVLGSVALITGFIFFSRFSAAAELIFYTILLAVSMYYVSRNTGAVVRDFYVTNAFFREFFGAGLKGEEQTEARKVEHLWWVPNLLRAHVWQFILQTDRILPAGRAIFAGHLFVLFLAYQRPDPQFLAIIWVLFATAHHLFILITFRSELSPPWLHRWLGSKMQWIWVRFWMQVRWTVPLLIGMNLQLFLFATPTFTIQGWVLLIYFTGAFFISMLSYQTASNDFQT